MQNKSYGALPTIYWVGRMLARPHVYMILYIQKKNNMLRLIFEYPE